MDDAIPLGNYLEMTESRETAKRVPEPSSATQTLK